jgi:hypothetical protein
VEKMTVEIEVMMDVILEFINPFSPMRFEHAFGDQSDCISDVKVNAAEIGNVWVPSIVFDNGVVVIFNVFVVNGKNSVRSSSSLFNSYIDK